MIEDDIKSILQYINNDNMKRWPKGKSAFIGTRQSIPVEEFVHLYRKANAHRKGCRTQSEYKRARWFLFGIGKSFKKSIETNTDNFMITEAQLRLLKSLAGELGAD